MKAIICKRIYLFVLCILTVVSITSCSHTTNNKASLSDQPYLELRKEFLQFYVEIGESISSNSAEDILNKVQKDENKAKIKGLKEVFKRMKEILPEKGIKDFNTLNSMFEQILFIEEQSKIGLGKPGSDRVEIIKKMTIIDVRISDLKDNGIQ